MDVQKQLRKYNSSLITCGKGIIAFGFWTVLKTVAIALLSLPQLHEAYANEVPAWLINLVTLLGVSVTGGLEVLFHLYLGGSAIKTGKKNIKRYLYIVVAFLYAIVITINCINWLQADKNEGEGEVRLEQAQDYIEYGTDDMDPELDGIGMIREDIGGIREDIDGFKDSVSTDQAGMWGVVSNNEAETVSGNEDAIFQIDNSRIYTDSLYSDILSFCADIMRLIILVELIVKSIKRLMLMRRLEAQSAKPE